MLKGKAVTVGEMEWIIPPLNFASLQTFEADLAEISGIESTPAVERFKLMRKAVPIIHAALKRNYKDITIDEVSELLDLTNFATIFQAVMGVEGGPSPGGVRPVPSSGASSTPS